MVVSSGSTGSFIAGIKAQAANAGSDAKINYRYEVDANGKLQVSGASISSSVEKPSFASAIAATSNSSTPAYSKQATSPFLQDKTLGLSPSELAEIFGLDSNENQVLSELQSADAGVRAHEAQHFRAAGGLVQGTATYDYVEGPDGNFYAVAGEVEINSQNGVTDDDKQARDAASLYNAATAPGDASAQDLSVARSALNKANQAYTKAIQSVSEGL